jgi:hypothetical protein
MQNAFENIFRFDVISLKTWFTATAQPINLINELNNTISK